MFTGLFLLITGLFRAIARRQSLPLSHICDNAREKFHTVNQRKLKPINCRDVLLTPFCFGFHHLSATLTTSLYTTQTCFNGYVLFLAEPQFGATFYLSAFACLLGIIVAIFLLCFAGEAGSGPINQCCCDTANNNAMDTARASTVVRGGGVADFGSLKSQGRSDDFRSNHHNEHVASNLSSVGRDPITAFPAERWASTSEAASNTAAEQKM